MPRDHVAPARPASGFAFLFSFAVLLIGIAVIMPRSAVLGTVWCVAALVAATFYGFEFFTRERVAAQDLEREE